MAMKEASIIEIIQKMVREGESEEKIIQTLKDLGVEPEKAKRLLLLGQADTFALLQNEISKIVSKELEKQKSSLKEFIEDQAETAAEKEREQLTKAVISDLKEYEKDITGQSKTFQEQIQENVTKVTELSDRVKVKLNELGEAVHTIQMDMDEIKLKGIGSRNKWISTLLLFMGIAFCIGDILLFYTAFQGEITIDTMIITVIMALIGITMIFVASVI
jgi:predicted phage tail protein